MPPRILLVVGSERDGFTEFRDSVEVCKAAGPLKVYAATKAVEAASQLNVSYCIEKYWLQWSP